MSKKKGLNLKKRRTVDIDELRAFRVAYDRSLGMKDYIKYVLGPGLLLGMFSFLLLYNVWVSLAFVVIGSIYGATFFLPKSIMKEYSQEGFNQRNRFLNNMTQVLTDQNQTILMALRKVIPRADGEFQEDLSQFHAMLVGADNERIRDAVIWFGDKYEDDVVFTQYLEQLETIMVEGKTNVDTLKDVKTYHNDIRKKQEYFERMKAGHVSDMRQLVVITVILLIALAVSFGFETYLEVFARHIIGYVTSFIYLLVLMYFFRQFSIYLFDDAVMEVQQ